MKLLLFICFIFCFSWLGTGKQKTFTVAPATANDTGDTIDFTKQIQPVLVSHCSPCHFPGGKMYERLPFDKDTTIVAHEAGILRRIKGDDNALIKAFVRQNH